MRWHDGSGRRGWRARLISPDARGADIDAVFGEELCPKSEYAPLQRVVLRMRAEACARTAPTPGAALAQRMDLGWVGERRSDVPAVLLPSPPRRVVAPRIRYAIAAAIGALVLTAGLAGAGALPSAIQDQISHALEKIGIKVPGSDASSRSGSPATQKGAPGGAAAARAGNEAGTAEHPSGSSTAGSSTTSTSLPSVTVPAVTTPDGTVVVPPIAVEIPGLPPITLPAVTLPPITEPPITVPPITVPPITLPPITLPPL